MVKAVIGEETRLNLAEDRLAQSSVASQVGLVIGKLSSPLDRGFVFDLIKTPPNDAGEEASSLVDTYKEDKKKGSKTKSAAADASCLVIDKDWVAEHARQVSRMLLGGMKVVGIYVWASEVAFKNSTMMLCQTVNGVAEAVPLLETDWNERLLLHACYSPRRWTCRNCKLTSNITSSTLRSCDFKMGRVLSSLQAFKCTYNFNLRLPIFHESGSSVQTLGDIIRNGICIHAEEFKEAKAVIDETLVVKDAELCTSGNFHDIELLMPFLKDTTIETWSQKDLDGILVISGSICSFAFLNVKEPISEAVAEVKGDIIKSLLSRLDIICDEASREQQLTDDSSKETNPDDSSKETNPRLSSDQSICQPIMHVQRKKCILSFPRRVFVPWLADTYICDYVQPYDPIEVVRDNCKELMSMEAPTDSSLILEPEKEAPSFGIESFWELAVPFQSASCSHADRSMKETKQEGDSKSSTKSTDIFSRSALFFLILSIIVGFVLYVIR